MAKQSYVFTEEITDKVKEIQSSTGHAIHSINVIGKTIYEISDINDLIAGTAKEQVESFLGIQEIMDTTSQSASAILDDINGVMTAVAHISDKNKESYSEIEHLFEKSRRSLAGS